FARAADPRHSLEVGRWRGAIDGQREGQRERSARRHAFARRTAADDDRQRECEHDEGRRPHGESPAATGVGALMTMSTCEGTDGGENKRKAPTPAAAAAATTSPTPATAAMTQSVPPPPASS